MTRQEKRERLSQAEDGIQRLERTEELLRDLLGRLKDDAAKLRAELEELEGDAST